MCRRLCAESLVSPIFFLLPLMPFVVEAREERFKKSVPGVRRVLLRVLKVLRRERAAVFVYLVSDGEIRRLNGRFRGKRQATNVLSFPEPKGFPHPEGGGRPLGDVYLAPDYIASRGENIVYLLIHGLLHLLGYTHDMERDKMRMERREASILRCVSTSHAAHHHWP